MKSSKLPYNHLLILVMLFGTILATSSAHWLIMWAGLELNLIGFMPLMLMRKVYSESEAAVKYFIVQSVGSIFFLFGSMFSYSLTNTWDCPTGVVGQMMIVGGLLIKLGSAPFHSWLPGVMASLSWGACFMLSTWQKLAPLYLLVCVGTELSHRYCIIFSLACVIVGGLGGTNQTQVRGLMAYSSISHLGWMLLGVALDWGIMAFYYILYFMMTGVVFFGLWATGLVNTSRSHSAGINLYNPWNMILMLSLAGLPPLLGFVPKLMLIIVVVSLKMWLVLVVFVMSSVISIYFYLKLFYVILLSTPPGPRVKMKSTSVYLLTFAVLVSVFGGIISMFLI
uniref:NADH-ubiquinone oxidoreductase chain 2 n=1 Tax=Dendropoma gregarium TaxID=169306 RepID=E2FLR0_9CAEN|nr:NADH dehydrogenase subunit 2 [Dendropoma gregarium]ADI79376.1 NADH dehydrogenase subunit 2 [Dendropoma gregarium]